LKIEKSETLGRNIRRDDPPELAHSTWEGVRQAIWAGKADEACAGIDYGCAEARMMHDAMCSFVDDALTHLAKVAGDESFYQFLVERYTPVMRRWLSDTPGVMESMQRAVEFQRGHFAELSVREESDRFVVTCDPCGSGGRMRRTKKVERVAKAYGWTWGKTEVPYYCTHCAVMWEMVPIQLGARPVRITLPPEKDSDPCVHLYYKAGKAIPEELLNRTSGGARDDIKENP